jgi:hypothetical protein
MTFRASWLVADLSQLSEFDSNEFRTKLFNPS